MYSSLGSRFVALLVLYRCGRCLRARKGHFRADLPHPSQSLTGYQVLADQLVVDKQPAAQICWSARTIGLSSGWEAR